ncbi:hypothetical protein P4O66_013397, partial [Electrophorus voltai]
SRGGNPSAPNSKIPLLTFSYDLSLEHIRDLTEDRLRYVLKLPVIRRHLEDQVIGRKRGFITKSMGITEAICSADMATGVKMGVVCGLYGGAVTNLGSPKQVEKFYVPVTELAFTAMFAMTERGHGSNVRGILTEARYDPSTQEFIIHTPCEEAQKMYIGNAMKGNYAAVFAQLIINGESHGLHGVDNGILTFDHVRIPRENLLGKFGSVSPDGQYTSPIQSKGSRFNAMLAALTPTRLALTAQAMAAMKLGLIIAVCYSHSRRQFGPKAQDEVKIIEHQTQYLRLMPHLATALALTFTTRYTAGLMDDALCQGQDLQGNRMLQALVAGLKAYSTWANIACLQGCRECTGAMGFMMENRIPSLKCDSDAFVTFEGDNMVMLQVVVRELLSQHARETGSSLVAGLIRNWTSFASDHLRTRSSLNMKCYVIICNYIQMEGVRHVLSSVFSFSVDKVGDLNFLLKALSYRERVLQRSLASRLYTKFCLLHGTSLVYQERAWYLEHKYLSPGASRQIRSQLLELCRAVKDDALKVVADFNVPTCCIQAPIAGVANPRAEWGFYPKPEMPPVQTKQRAMSKL